MAKDYEVLKITELSRVGAAGGVELFFRHQIKTKGGVVLTADIDENDFTPEKTAVILTAKAQNADKILAQ